MTTNLKEAALIVPVYRDDNNAGIIFIRRTDKGMHGNQLSFPGGRIEPFDNSPLDAALRETNEEIGIPRTSVEVLEHLPAVTTRTTGFQIHPFLARINLPEKWTIQEDEVKAVIFATIEDLAKPVNHGYMTTNFPSWSDPRKVPFIQVNNDRLWGVSYRILNPLIPRLFKGEWAI